MFIFRRKGTLQIIRADKDLEKLKSKIINSFHSTRGLLPRGTLYSFEEYMKEKVISKVEFTDMGDIWESWQ
jgi:hypothetical protein